MNRVISAISIASLGLAIVTTVFVGLSLWNKYSLPKKVSQPIITITHDTTPQANRTEYKVSWGSVSIASKAHQIKIDSNVLTNLWKQNKLIPGETYNFNLPRINHAKGLQPVTESLQQKKDNEVVNVLAGKISEAISPAKSEQSIDIKLMAKIVLSFIFTIAALYVVLSKKYDDETKKWAFSILSLVTGIWLGTASS